MEKPCILYEDREAYIGCGDCRCEYDPEKICDNCMACVKDGAEYRSILIAGVRLSEDEEDEKEPG